MPIVLVQFLLVSFNNMCQEGSQENSLCQSLVLVPLIICNFNWIYISSKHNLIRTLNCLQQYCAFTKLPPNAHLSFYFQLISVLSMRGSCSAVLLGAVLPTSPAAPVLELRYYTICGNSMSLFPLPVPILTSVLFPTISHSLVF